MTSCCCCLSWAELVRRVEEVSVCQVIPSKQSPVIPTANLQGVLPCLVCGVRIRMFPCLLKSLEQGEARVISASAISQQEDQTRHFSIDNRKDYSGFN